MNATERFRVVVALGLCVAVSARCGEATNDRTKLIDAIETAQEGVIDALPHGQGVALLRTSVVPDGKEVRVPGLPQGHPEMLVRFMFSNGKFRSAYYIPVAGAQPANKDALESATLIEAEVNTGEKRFRYLPGRPNIARLANASIEKPGSTKHALGRDFRPSTFNCVDRYPIPVRLRIALREAKRFRSEFRADGLLRIRAEGHRRHPGRLLDAEYLLDPGHRYALVSVQETTEVDDKGTSLKTELSVEYGSGTGARGDYPERIVERQLWTDRARKRTAEWTIDIKILEFDASTEISPQCFTQRGLDIPPGTTVADRVLRSVYRYEAIATDEEILKQLLDH